MSRPRTDLRARALVLSVIVIAALTACTATPDSTGPEPAPVDALTATIRCMEERGFEATADAYGGFSSPEMGPEQSALWREAAEECKAETGWGVENYDDEQLAELYALEVEQFDCLVDLGYTPQEPPSLQSYIESWGGGSEPPYQPFASVIAGLKAEEQQRILEECPPPRWTFAG